MKDKTLKYGTLGFYSYFFKDNIELHLPVDISLIKSSGLKKIIETIDAFVGFSLDFEEKNLIISIRDSAIFHNSNVDLPSVWNLTNGTEVVGDFGEFDDNKEKVDISSFVGVSIEFQRIVSIIRNERKKYHINPEFYGILDKLRFLPKGDMELILPLDLTCLKDDPLHQNIKKMIQSMSIFVAFSFVNHKNKDLIILLDDNVFGDLAYHNEKWNLKTNSLVNTEKNFEEFDLDKEGQLKTLDKGITIYVSYSTKDSNKYRIAIFSKELAKMPKIQDVLYWEEDMNDDIYHYMENNIKKCNVLLLFCSQNALNSEPVNMQWQAALKIKKKIIPIFTEESEIPALLSTKLGVFFEEDNLQGTLSNIYYLIMKKLKKV